MFSSPIADCSRCSLGIASAGACPFVPLSLDAGERLVRRGEPLTRIFFIRSGLASLLRTGSDGREQSLFVRGPGALLCGEALHGCRSGEEVRALVPLRICALDVATVRQWAGAGGAPVSALLDLLARELLERQQDLDLRHGDSLQRVARLLLACGGRLPVSKQIAARMLGMRPETLSRGLRALAERALIDREESSLILDADAMRQLAATG